MTKYIVMMPNSWGAGATIAEAEKVARREGHHGRKKVKRLCWKFSTDKTPKAYVNEWGQLCWFGDEPERIDLDASNATKV